MNGIPLRTANIAAAVLVWLLALLAQAVVAPARADPDFYDPAGIDLSSYPPGGLIRYQPIERAPDGASAYRVLYRSTGMRDEPIAVSGVVITPNSPSPAAGRPIVAWAQGESKPRIGRSRTTGSSPLPFEMAK
jgi:hypothetical protein